VEGEFDITGTVEFKECVEGNEGYVYIYIDGSSYGYKWYEGTSVRGRSLTLGSGLRGSTR